MFLSQSLPALRRFGVPLLALALFVAPAALRAADDNPPSLTDATGEALGKLKPLIDVKNWNGALQIVNDLIPKTEANSYDMAVIMDTKSKILLQKSDYAGSLAPMEQAIKLSDAHHYFNTKATLDMLYLLAQVYYEEGSNEKSPLSKETRQQYMHRSIQILERWMSISTKTNTDVMTFYATLLYNEAMEKNPEHADQEIIKKCQAEVEKILKSSIHPKENTYQLYLATIQQQGNYAKAAELLEMLVARNPTNKTFWQQLVGLYLNLAGTSEKDPAQQRKYYIRAINAQERAESHGFLTTPKDNYNLVTVYYTVGQFGKATELLYAGLKNGTIVSELKNWELLASSYQQINEDYQAIDVLKEAARDPRFANNGQIDFQIGQIYSGELNKITEAYPYYQAAVRKPGVEHPFSVYMFLAYTAFELERFQDALDAVNSAAKYPEAAKDKQLPHLHDAIVEAIKERAAQAEAAKRAAS